MVCRAVSLAVRSLRDHDQQAAQEVLNLKDQIRVHAERVLARESQQLRPDRPEFLRVLHLQTATVDKLRHVYRLARQIARVSLPLLTSGA